MRAVWNGQTIAESNDTVVVEGNHYFPIDSVKPDYLTPSDATSVCPWKGTASYYTLSVDGADNVDAGWYYPQPKDAAANIRGRVAFWRGVTVEPGDRQPAGVQQQRQAILDAAVFGTSSG